ncbi:MAG TPA: phosphoglycerate kinase [Candidatus Paceibacterota bacterium]|nr:phosphoglycerate kinase [Candidatus Paceibacterota bacterium]
MKKYKKISEATIEPGTKVLVRCDFNVPIANGEVTDDFRIQQSLETIRFLVERGAVVLLISHIESGEGTLRPVLPVLQKLLPHNTVAFCTDVLETCAETIKHVTPGSIILSENIRLYDGEKKNDIEFAKSLRALADVYVNEAFSVSHRTHATVSALPKLFGAKSYAGFQFDTEISMLSIAFNAPKPFIFILGGAKFDTKLPLIKRFMHETDLIFVGGALAHNFYIERGDSIGTSLVSEGQFQTVEIARSGKVTVPEEVVIETDKEGHQVRIGTPHELKSTERIVDAAPSAIEALIPQLQSAVCVVWNGPLGSYEEGYDAGTLLMARLIAEHTPQSAKKIVGGGDTLAAIQSAGVFKEYTFVSTGGGAMLDFLSAGTIPGLEALS